MQHRGCGNTGMLNFNFRLKDGGGGGSNPLGSRDVSLSKQITFEKLTHKQTN